MGKLQIKWLAVLGLFAVAGVLLYPSLTWYTLPADERARREAYRERPKYLLNLGLDLKGGTHLILELDVSKLPPDADLSDAMSRAIETIRNRVDAFGVAEPLIARQGTRWIVVQLPGITNSEHAKSVLGQTARLEFRIVDSSEAAVKAANKIIGMGDPFERPVQSTSAAATFEGIKVASWAAAALPPGTVLLPAREDARVDFYIASASVPITGEYLTKANVTMGGDFGLPIVEFEFNAEGGRIFGDLTGANVQKDLAIILDGIVYSAPTIKGRIPGKGIIEGNFKLEEARKLAIVLRSGALPAPLRIIEERTVGPTLGEDSIRAGLLAVGVGLLLLFAFMAAYYRLSGLMATGTLMANIVLLLAVMAYVGATLTLPGIVGVILTMAMAIDANVLIFERIREELRAGKPPRIAMDAGYDKAFSAILDSNVTTVMAAALLFQFGTGPIKGFAVTLTVGCTITLFTAVVLNRLMHQSWLANPDVEELSI